MKKIITLIIAMTALIACQNTPSQKLSNNDLQIKKIEKIEKKDPVPHTISQQEVARIALLEAKQLITNAKNHNVNLSSARETYDKAQTLYDKGEFKKAQITAVDVRHQVEKLTMTKATSDK